MNKRQLIAALAARTTITKVEADRQIHSLIDIISDTLEAGGKINLNGFGVFEVRERAARTGRNPRTGESIKIQPARVPAFKAGTALKAALNNAKK